MYDITFTAAGYICYSGNRTVRSWFFYEELLMFRKYKSDMLIRTAAKFKYKNSRGGGRGIISVYEEGSLRIKCMLINARRNRALLFLPWITRELWYQHTYKTNKPKRKLWIMPINCWKEQSSKRKEKEGEHKLVHGSLDLQLVEVEVGQKLW